MIFFRPLTRPCHRHLLSICWVPRDGLGAGKQVEMDGTHAPPSLSAHRVAGKTSPESQMTFGSKSAFIVTQLSVASACHTSSLSLAASVCGGGGCWGVMTTAALLGGVRHSLTECPAQPLARSSRFLRNCSPNEEDALKSENQGDH